MKYERDIETRNAATCRCACVEIACVEASTCGAAFSPKVIFLGDTALSIELIVPVSVNQ